MGNFNPYQAWLDIDHDEPNYYQLLQVSPSEEDTEQIRQCAIAQLKLLASVSDPAHAQLKERLAIRIKRAAKCLMDDELRVKYDRKLLARAAEAPAADADEVVVATIVDRPLPDQSTAFADPIPSSISRQYRAKHRHATALWLCIVLGIICLLGVAFLVATQTSLGSLLGGRTGSQPAPHRPAFDDGAEPLPMNEPAPAPDDQQPVDRDESVVDREAEPLDDTRQGLRPSSETNNNDDDRPTTEERRQLAAALQAARQELARRQPQLARDILSGVQAVAMRKPDREKFERLVLLTDYVGQYWQSLDDALNQLESGTELVVNGNRMIIVDVDPQQLILRSRGRNVTYSRDSLPQELQLALADGWFDRDAVSTKVFRGAMMAVAPEFSADQARELWQQASDAGADIGDLERVLEDVYELETD